jgi:hypothetical protein
MTKPRFQVKSDRRVYAGNRYLCTANTIGDATRIVAALELAAEPAPKTLPPSPSAEDGTPEIPNGYTRVVMDYRTAGLELNSERDTPDALFPFRGVNALFGSTSMGPPMTKVETVSGGTRLPARGLLRKFVQRGTAS